MHSCLVVTPSPLLVLESVKLAQYGTVSASSQDSVELLASIKHLGVGSTLHRLEWSPKPEQQGVVKSVKKLMAARFGLRAGGSNSRALASVEVALREVDPDAMEIDAPLNTALTVTADANTVVAAGINWATARQQVHEHIYWNQLLAHQSYELFQLLYTACFDGHQQRLLPGFTLQQAPPEIPGVSRCPGQAHFAQLLELLAVIQGHHDSSDNSSSHQEPPATSEATVNSQADRLNSDQNHPASEICRIVEKAVLWYCAQGSEDQTINCERVEQLHLLPWHTVLAGLGPCPPAAEGALLLLLLLSEPSLLEKAVPPAVLGTVCTAAMATPSLSHITAQLAASTRGQLGPQRLRQRQLLQLLLSQASSLQEIMLLGVLFSHHVDMPAEVERRVQQLFHGVGWHTLLEAGSSIMPALQQYMHAQPLSQMQTQQPQRRQQQPLQQQKAQQQEQKPKQQQERPPPEDAGASASAHPASAAASAALISLLQQELAYEATGRVVSLSILADILRCCIRQVAAQARQQEKQQQQQPQLWPQLADSLPKLLNGLVPAGAWVDAAKLMDWLIPIPVSATVGNPTPTTPHHHVDAAWQWRALLQHAPGIAGQLLSIASSRQTHAGNTAAEPAVQPGSGDAGGSSVSTGGQAWKPQQHMLQRLLHPSLAIRLQELGALVTVPRAAGKALMDACEYAAQQLPVHVLAMEVTRASSYAVWKLVPGPSSSSSSSSTHVSKKTPASKAAQDANSAAGSQGPVVHAEHMELVLRLQQRAVLVLAGLFSKIAPVTQWHQLPALPAVQLLVPAEVEALDGAMRVEAAVSVDSSLRAMLLYIHATTFQAERKPSMFLKLQILTRHISQLKQAAQPAAAAAAAMEFNDAHMTADVLHAAVAATRPTMLQVELRRLAAELPLPKILSDFTWLEMFDSTLAQLQKWLEITARSADAGDHEQAKQLLQRALAVVQQDAKRPAQKLYPRCCDPSIYRCGFLLDKHVNTALASSSHLIESQLYRFYLKQQLACSRPTSGQTGSIDSSGLDAVQHVIQAVPEAAAFVMSVRSSLCSGEITWTAVPQVYKRCMSAEQLQQEASILADGQNPPVDVQQVLQHLQLCQAGSPWVWQQLVQELLQFCQVAGFSLAVSDIEGLQQQLGSSFEWPSGDRLPLFAPEGQASVAALRQQLHTELHRLLGLVPQQCSSMLQHHELLQPLSKFVKELRLRMSGSRFWDSTGSSSSLEAAATTLRVRCLSDRSLQPAVMQLDNLLLPASRLSSMDLNSTARQLLPRVQHVLEGLGALHRSPSSLSQMPIQPLLDLLFSPSAEGSVSSSQLSLLLDPSARLRISAVRHSSRSSNSVNISSTLRAGDFCVKLLKADGRSEIANPASQCEVMLMALNHSWPSSSNAAWQAVDNTPDAHLLDCHGQQAHVHRWELLLLKQRIEHLHKVAHSLWQLQQLGHPVAKQYAVDGQHSTAGMVVCEFMPQPCVGDERLAQVLARQGNHGISDVLKDLWRWEQQICAPYMASSLQQLLQNCQHDLKRLWQLLPWTLLVPAADLLQWQGRRHLFWDASRQQWAGKYCRLAQNIPVPWQHWQAVAEQAPSSSSSTFFKQLCKAAAAIVSGMIEAAAEDPEAAATTAAAVAVCQQTPLSAQRGLGLSITAGKGNVLLALTDKQHNGAELAAAILEVLGVHQPTASCFFSCSTDSTQQAVASLCCRIEQAASFAGAAAAQLTDLSVTTAEGTATAAGEAEFAGFCTSHAIRQCLFVFNAQALSPPAQEMLAAALLQLCASECQALVVVTCADNDCQLAQLLSSCLWAEAWQWLAETTRLGTLTDACLLAASPASIICGPPLSGKTSQAVLLLQQNQRSILRDQHWQISISQDTTERQLLQMLEQHITNTQQSAGNSARLLVYVSIGCNAPCIAANLAGTLLSLLTCGVAGQGIDTPLHLPANTHILLEVGDLKQLPPLSMLPGACVTHLPSRPLLQAPSAPVAGLEQLAQQLELQQRSTVTDEDVICCLAQHWPPASAREQQQQQEAALGTLCSSGSAQRAFTYTPQVLRRLAQVHSHIVAGSASAATQPGSGNPSSSNSSSEPVPVAMPKSLPVVLLGDTGCGKTYLLQKLVELYRSISRSHGQAVHFRPITISQASSEAELCSLFREAYNDALMASSNSRGNGSGDVWFYLLDEVNTTPALDFCKRLLVERARTLDTIEASGPPGVCKLLPNLIVMATCNPRNSSVGDSDSTQQYDVLELPPSLEAVAITYAPGSMTLADKEAFVSQHLQHPQLQAALFAAQQLVQQHEGQPITMRDTQRFLNVLHQLSGTGGGSSTNGSNGNAGEADSVRRAQQFRSLLQLQSTITPAHTAEAVAAAAAAAGGGAVVITTAQVLALYLCYGMQLQDRSLFYQHPAIQQLGDVEGAVGNVQQAVFQALQLPQHIIPTSQLLDNLAAMLLATFLRKPLLVMGDPGVSKSLALSLLMDRMRGQLSDSPLLNCLPRLQPFWLQMSPQTTASSLRQLADAALDWSSAQQKFSSAATLPAIILEELSMAPRAATGPLKALHYLLDKPLLQGGQQLPYGFFATSNFSNWSAGQAGAGSNSGSQQHRQPQQMPFDAAVCGRMLVLKLPAFEQPDVVKLAAGVAQGCAGRGDGLAAPVLAAIQAACAARHGVDAAASSTANARLDAAAAACTSAADGSSRVMQEALLRDLLHFSCSLACQQLPAAHSSASNNLETELVRSFLLHMQLTSSSKTASLVQQLMGPGVLERLPSQPELLRHLLSPAAVPARHILLVYTTALQLSQQLKCITAAKNALEKAGGGGGALQEGTHQEESFWVHGNRPWYQDCGMWSVQEPSAASRQLTWVCKIKAGLEQGAVLVLQHPQCLLPSLHAVLNASFAAAATDDSGSKASSGQLSVLFIGNRTESLVVRSSARIVLLVHAADLQQLHPSVISRLSILHPDLQGASKGGSPTQQQQQQQRGLGAAGAAVPLRPSQLAAHGTQLAEKLWSALNSLGNATTTAEPGSMHQQQQAEVQLQALLREASALLGALEAGLVDVLRAVKQAGRATYVSVVCCSPVTAADWCNSWDEADGVTPTSSAAARCQSQLEGQQRPGLSVIVVRSYLTANNRAGTSLGPRRGVGLAAFNSQLPPEQQLLEQVQRYLQQCITAQQQGNNAMTLVLDVCGCSRQVVLQCLSLLGLAGLKASSMAAELMGDAARNHHKLVKAAAGSGCMQLLVACDPVMAPLCAPAAVCCTPGMTCQAFWLESLQPALPEAGSFRQLAFGAIDETVAAEQSSGSSSSATVRKSGNCGLQQLLSWLHGQVVSHVALLSHLPASTQERLVSLLTAAVTRHWPLLGAVGFNCDSGCGSSGSSNNRAAGTSATFSTSYRKQVLFVASLLQLVGQLSGQEQQLRIAGSVRAAVLHQLRSCVHLVVLQYLTRLQMLLTNQSLLSDTLSTGWLQQLLANNAFPWQRSLSQQLSEANSSLITANTVALSAQLHMQLHAECSGLDAGGGSGASNGDAWICSARAAALAPLLEDIVKRIAAVGARGSASYTKSAAAVADDCHSAFPLSQQQLPAVLQDDFVGATVWLAYLAHGGADNLPCIVPDTTTSSSSSSILPALTKQQGAAAAVAVVQHVWNGSLSHLAWVLLNYSEHIAVACGMSSSSNSSRKDGGSRSPTAVWFAALDEAPHGQQGAAAAPDALLYALLVHTVPRSCRRAASKAAQLQLQITPAVPLMALHRVLHRPCPVQQVADAADACLMLHLYLAVMLGHQQTTEAEMEHTIDGGKAAKHAEALAAVHSFMEAAASATGCRLKLLDDLPEVQQQQVAIMLCQALLQAESSISTVTWQERGSSNNSNSSSCRLPTRSGLAPHGSTQGMQFRQHSCVLLAALLQHQQLVWLAADLLHKLCWPPLLLTGAAGSSVAAAAAIEASAGQAVPMASAGTAALKVQDLDAAYRKCKQLMEGCFCREVSCKPHVWSSNVAACGVIFFNAWLPHLPATTVSTWLQQQLLLTMMDVGQNKAVETHLGPGERQEAQHFVGLWVLLLAAQWLPRVMAEAAVDRQLQLQLDQQLILYELLNGGTWGQSSSEVFRLVLQPLRNYSIRLLLQRFDTTLLPRLAGCVSALGPWSQAYFTGADAAATGMWLPLLLLPDVLANVKQQATAAAAEGSRQLSAAAFTEPLAAAAGSRTQLHLQDLLPLLQGNAELRPMACFAAYWLHLVASEPSSVFHWSKLNPSSHQSWLFPAMPENEMAMMRRLASSLGITAFNRCSCGATYGNGECGLPNQLFKCPTCKQQAGGSNHGARVVAGNHGTNDGDVLYGIQVGDSFDAATRFERDMSPEQYRIVLVLLLTVMAVSGEAGSLAACNRQYSQHLTACVRVLQQLWGVPAADVQLLLLFLLQRCGRQLLLPDVAHQAPLRVRDAGSQQFEMEHRLMEAVQQHCPQLLTAAGRQELLQQAQQVLESEETRQLTSPAAGLKEQAVQALHLRSPAAAAAEFAPMVLTLPQAESKLGQMQQFFVSLPQQVESGQQQQQQQQQQMSQGQLPLLKLLLGERPEQLRCALLSIYYLPTMCTVWGLMHDYFDAVLPLDGAAEQQQQQLTLAAAALRAGVTRRQLGEFVHGWNAVAAAAGEAAARYDCQEVQLPSISSDSISAAQVVVAEGSMGRGLLSIMCTQHNLLVDAIVCACKHSVQAQQLSPYSAATAGFGGSATTHGAPGDVGRHSFGTQLVSPELLCSLLDTFTSLCVAGAPWPPVGAIPAAAAASSSAAGRPIPLAEQLWQQLCCLEVSVARQYQLMRPLYLLAAQSWPDFHYQQTPSMIVQVSGLVVSDAGDAGSLHPGVRDLLQQVGSQEEQHELMGLLHKAAAKWNTAGGAYAPGTAISKLLGYQGSRSGVGTSSSSAARGNTSNEAGNAMHKVLHAATAADLPGLQQLLAAQLSKGSSVVDKLGSKYCAVLPSEAAAALAAAVAAAAAGDLANLRSCLQDVTQHVASCVEPPPPEQPLRAWLYAMEPAQVEALVPEACMLAHLGAVMQIVA